MTNSVADNMKTCSRCKKEKTIDSFYIMGTGKPYSRCKLCVSEARIERTSLVSSMANRRENSKRLAAARELGKTHFMPVTSCVRGHKSKKLVSTQQCCECLKERKISMRKSTREEMTEKKRSKVKRGTAKNLGKTHYETGMPCKNGHVAKRLVSTGQCTKCLAGRPQSGSKASENARRRLNAKRRSRQGRVKQRRYQSDVLSKRESYKITAFIRSSVRRVLNETGLLKNDSYCSIIGYRHSQLKAKIEYGFMEGMSWDNYGEWHIDHTIPISHFISKGETRPSVINSLCNLKPMWAKDNLSKGAKWQPATRAGR